MEPSKIIEEIESTKSHLKNLEYQRRMLIRGMIASEFMTLSELFQSLNKNKVFGSYNGLYAHIKDNIVKVYIARILKNNLGETFEICSSDPLVYPLIFEYQGEEFVKSGTECAVSDCFVLDVIKTNGWEK